MSNNSNKNLYPKLGSLSTAQRQALNSIYDALLNSGMESSNSDVSKENTL